MQATTTGGQNTAVGSGALFFNVVGNKNVAVGNSALGNSTGINNTGVGSSALIFTTSGNGNTALGSAAGATIITGSNNTLIGKGVDVNLGTAAGRIAIGISSASVSAQAVLDDSLYFHKSLGTNPVVGGTSSPVRYEPATGQMGPDASSRRFKTDIVALESNTAKLFDLRPVTFTLKGNGSRDFGYIAEEVAEVLPELVPRDAEGKPYGVNYDRIVVLLVEEVRKLRDIVLGKK
jgi:hypothetical protein